MDEIINILNKIENLSDAELLKELEDTNEWLKANTDKIPPVIASEWQEMIDMIHKKYKV